MKTLLGARWSAMAHLRDVLREQSWFKLGFVLLFAVGLEAGLWSLFLEGLKFLDRLGGVGFIVIPKLFALFFFGLSLMLILSSVLTTYTSLYRSDETAFLMMNPLPLQDVILFKYLESAYYASWAFFFIIIPFVGAYAMYADMPWYFSLWALLYSMPFVLICSGAGFILTVVVVRWMPGRRVLAVTGWAAALLGVALIWKLADGGRDTFNETTLVLSNLIPGMKVASFPLWPSWWTAEGMLSFARAQWLRGFMLLGVLCSSALMMGLAAETAGRLLFVEGWQKMIARPHAARRHPVLLQPLDKLLSFLPQDIRCLCLKDVRLFLRDPQQWMQVLIFFGLLAIYFVNLRKFHYHLLPPEWRNLISFLNIFSTSAVLCSLGSRFVYPQMSLEGQAFWVIGMAPTTMRRVLAAKFILALTGMLLISVGLMALSSGMLDLDPLARLVTLVIAASMAFAVSGLSTGLGAIFLDLRQRNPSAIVSGFGGTMNLVLCLSYMILVILPFAVTFHLKALGNISHDRMIHLMLWGLAGTLGLTIISVLTPLRLAQKSLLRREY
ncbi:MAG: hypothetical protein V2A34_08210 [Lentisphaerota bacterium]